MDEQREDDQLKLTYSSSVPIWDVARRLAGSDGRQRRVAREGQGYPC